MHHMSISFYIHIMCIRSVSIQYGIYHQYSKSTHSSTCLKYLGFLNSDSRSSWPPGAGPVRW